MKRTLNLIVLYICCTGIAMPAFSAQSDYFLELTGIDGESQDRTHAGSVEILSWSWGETNDASLKSGNAAASAKSGQTLSTDFTFTKTTDSVSPKLALVCLSGKQIDKVELTVRKAGSEPVEYITITMKKVLVTSFSTGGSGDDVVPVDTISLNFGAIKFEYIRQDEGEHQGEPVDYEWSDDKSVVKR